MAFTSPFFLFCFLPAALALVLTAGRWGRTARQAALVAVSLVFAAWSDGWLVLVLAGAAIGNWRLGLALERAETARRSRLLTLGVAANLALLAWFKYARFLAGAAGLALPEGLLPERMPLGVSFFTFSALAYLVDVSRSRAAATASLLDFSAFLTFFPRLAAGPIARQGQTPEIALDRNVLVEGARRFVIGLGKKTLLATPLAVLADGAFRISGPDAATAWLGVLAYGLQLYFDFSGYTDMAIGLGLWLGVRLPENFDHPYAAQSVREFWRRWHMSLSSWFRDYLYIPLGGGRGSAWAVQRNLFVVFLLCGLWHGASWTFVAWGAWHGLFLALERAGLGAAVERAPRPLRHAYALAAVFGGWVLFRAGSLPQAGEWLAALLDLPGLWRWTTFDYFQMTFLTRQAQVTLLAAAVGSLPLLTGLFGWSVRNGGTARIDDAARPDRIAGTASPVLALTGDAALLVVLLLSALQLASSAFSPFIYATF